MTILMAKCCCRYRENACVHETLLPSCSNKSRPLLLGKKSFQLLCFTGHQLYGPVIMDPLGKAEQGNYKQREILPLL